MDEDRLMKLKEMVFSEHISKSAIWDEIDKIMDEVHKEILTAYWLGYDDAVENYRRGL